MKNNVFLLAILCVSLSAFAQTPDTTFLSISQENGPFEKQRFIDQYDYVFGTKQPTRLLLKLNLVPVVLPLGENALEDDFRLYRNILEDVGSTSRAELGIEWKATPALSVHASGSIPTRGSDYYNGHYRGGGWRVEPRWYYDMPRRMRAGQQANNVSGNYISIDYQEFRQRDRDQEPSPLFQRYQFRAISLRYGLQRRLLRFGFIDMSIGAGFQAASYESESYTSTRSTQSDQGLFLETRVAAGFSFGAPRATKSDVSFCDVLRCFQEDRALWKISLAKALRVNQAGLSANPKASYEHKLGSSSFSIETEAEVFLTTYRDFGEGLQVRKFGAGLNVQPRWYFLQKRRIAKGKSGNNLNGVFAGMIGGYRRTAYPGRTVYGESPDNFYVAPHVGIQQRLFRHGFIQYKFGLLYSDLLSNNYDYFPDPTSFLSELQVGFAF